MCSSGSGSGSPGGLLVRDGRSVGRAAGGGSSRCSRAPGHQVGRLQLRVIANPALLDLSPKGICQLRTQESPGWLQGGLDSGLQARDRDSISVRFWAGPSAGLASSPASPWSQAPLMVTGWVWPPVPSGLSPNGSMSTFVCLCCEGPESHLSHVSTRERSHGLGVLCVDWLGQGHMPSWSWGGAPQYGMKGGCCESPSKSQGLSLGKRVHGGRGSSCCCPARLVRGSSEPL